MNRCRGKPRDGESFGHVKHKESTGRNFCNRGEKYHWTGKQVSGLSSVVLVDGMCLPVDAGRLAYSLPIKLSQETINLASLFQRSSEAMFCSNPISSEGK